MAVKNVVNTGRIRDKELDEELADVLVAISVITRRLARKISENLKKMEVPSNGYILSFPLSLWKPLR